MTPPYHKGNLSARARSWTHVVDPLEGGVESISCRLSACQRGCCTSTCTCGEHCGTSLALILQLLADKAVITRIPTALPCEKVVKSAGSKESVLRPSKPGPKTISGF